MAARTVGLALGEKNFHRSCEKERDRKETMQRRCPHCAGEFETDNPRKRYCGEQHRRNAANARYRARHRESASCKGCGASFERSATSQRKQSYCSLDCQYESRSREYTKRTESQAVSKEPSVEQPPSQAQPEPTPMDPATERFFSDEASIDLTDWR